ncbi:MAG: acetate--CoA ligase family protein [Candidatus Nezhaarchaeota archaeon]|nr:acetate--CoA ligase family protein [Candidatus Nezhaarchaeota archaeon]
MVRLYEYQGKEILKSVGIKVPRGGIASTPEEARKIAESIGKTVAIKAQILATGRFKAGGIRFASTPYEAELIAKELIGATIKGLKVKRVLIEEKLSIKREFYVGITVDDSYKVRSPVIIFSTEGGIDIEEVAMRSPEKVASLIVDYLEGIDHAKAHGLVSKLGVELSLAKELSDVIVKLYQVFKRSDARIIEVNPLALTDTGEIYAVDCRVTIDDDAVFRHPELGVKLPRDMDREPTELEEIAWEIEERDYRGTAYFAQLITDFKDGEVYIGFHGIGGGGAMLAASELIARGFKLVNYADTSGDPTASKVYRVIKAIFSLPIDAYVLMGSCLANQEQWYHGFAIVKALREELKDKPGFPVLILIAGNREKETHEIIRRGLEDLPIRLEIYGREYVYQTAFIADRVKALVDEYLKERNRERGK